MQQTLEAAIEAFTGETQRVRFAGRTDAGVHALGQVVTLDTRTPHSPARFRRALNHFLPPDVAVRSACEAPSDFEPRRHATSRRYRYVIEDGRPRSPLTRHAAWQRDDLLDAQSMAEAASLLAATRERGLNALDTADVYTGGESERIVGRLVKADRERWIIATKAAVPIGSDPNDRGTSRRWLTRAVEASLARLNIDVIDPQRAA